MNAIPVPQIGKYLTWRNAFFASATAMAVLTAWNFFHAMSYSSAPGADPNAEITGWLYTVAPGILAAVLGGVAKMLGASPEYVSAMRAFASNPTVIEYEKRAINAAVEFLLPKLGKYPEMILAILRTISPNYQSDPEVTAAIGTLGQALTKNFLNTPPTPPTT